MDILIALILILIAWGIHSGKPFEIIIRHKIEPPKALTLQELDPNAELPVTNIDEVINSLNEIILGGVPVDRIKST